MRIARLLLAVAALAVTACTSVTVDEMRRQADLIMDDGDYVVVLGRRQSSNYETEPELVSCISSSLRSNDIPVVPEEEFVDGLYPWFEPRIAPMRVKEMNRLLKRKLVADRIDAYRVRYIIWVDGNTETVNSSGSIGCSVGAGGIGCFGFGTWDKQSDYEATVWDYRQLTNLGKVSADVEGTSYMPAVIIPIPLIAKVQKNACKALAAQLSNFFVSPDNAGGNEE